MVALIPIVPGADSGWYLVIPLIIAGSGFGLLVSQLNNYTLAPISEERISEAAGVNSAGGSFGLSFGLAFAGAVMLATLSFLVHQHGRGQRRAPTGRPATGRRGAGGRRRGDEQHASSTSCSTTNPSRSRTRSSASTPRRGPRALQFALLVPILAALIGLINSFRMVRLPETTPSAAVEGMAWG